MSKPQYNPAALRALMLQYKKEADSLRQQLTQLGANSARAVSFIEKLTADRAHALKLLWALVTRLPDRRTSLLLDELGSVPKSAYVHHDFESVSGAVILQAYDQVPKQLEQAAMAARQASLGQFPLTDGVEPAEPEPESGTCQCPDRPTTGLRCPSCGLRLP